METRWGWVMSGRYPSTGKSKVSTFIVNDLINIEGRPLTQLWDLETLGIRDPIEKQREQELAIQTQQHFVKTVQRLNDGRYEIKLPWLFGAKEKLPSNYFVASRRLRSTTKDLQAKGYLQKYDELFLKWMADGIIEEEKSIDKLTGHYLPHRAVVKLSSTTTPIRPVFDGSSKVKGRLSLNDCLDKGPNMLELIPPILTRFRLRKVGVIADVERAFQQISITPEDREFLRFLWWKTLDCKQELVYRHKRVVFGVTSSPYLLAATLHHHLQQFSGDEAIVAAQLMQSTYTDNTILSVNNLQEAEHVRDVAVTLLMKAKFNLRGWEFGPCEDGGVVSVLGCLWDKQKDELCLSVSKVKEKLCEEPTLRLVLSWVHSIFDPLGFATPFTLRGKLLLQRCHAGKSGLDGKLTQELSEDVKKWVLQIPVLENLRVPRHVKFGENSRYSLHLLCDASSAAAAAAVYLRKEDDDSVEVFLLMSKSRVAPKGKATIPRLELLACVIGANLLHTVTEMLNFQDLPLFCWSDSTTALSWIKGAGPWGVFVTNCVAKVIKITSVSSWQHIPGKENIADLPSRGCSAKKLLESRWWEGPAWLRLPSDQWPRSQEIPDDLTVDAERKKVVVTMLAAHSTNFMNQFLRLSEYPRMIHAIAVWLRLKQMLKEKISGNQTTIKFEKEITAAELKNAEFTLFQFLQEDFREHPEKLKKLNAYQEEGLFRLNTKLTEEDEDFRSPVILPSKNEFVEQLIWWEHISNCHVGVSSLIGILRERVWIVSARHTVRRVLTKCWKCTRHVSRRCVVPEAPLPLSRTTVGTPFEVVGLDAAGPLFLREGHKVWILLFTCATFRAIHLELVDTVSAEGFLTAFRRFIANYGRPSVVYSDNALGFKRAQKIIASTSLQKVIEYAAVNKIEWRFSAPSAPWWGGWWERLIGMTKQLIRRVLGKKVVTRWELDLLLLEVRECLNNRPLTYQSDDDADPVPLTPNHFLRCAKALHFPEADINDAKSTRAAMKKLQRLREALRSRFRREYLGFLRGKTVSRESTPLKVGDVVIVEMDNFKRQDWPLAVVLEAIPGRDGKFRLFRLKTKNGELLRPAQRLFLMEQTET